MLSTFQQSGFMQCLLRRSIDGADQLQTKCFLLPFMIFICHKYVTVVIPDFRTFILWISGDHIEKHCAFVSHLLFFNVFMS